MKKILLIIIIILLLVLGYVSLKDGIQIGKFQISSIMQIEEKSKEFEIKAEELNSLIDLEYPKKRTELSNAGKKMQEAKQKYLDETNLSSDEEIQNALQIESYDIERLWAKVGNHATTEGVNLKLTLNPSSSGSTEARDLSFTVDGTYIGITNFIYAMEDDQELRFRIYNFKLLPYQNEILQATFLVKDVRITSNSLNEGLNTTTQTSTENENTQTNSENSNTVN